ncbi:hypothetical protein [Vibrio sp. M260112]|uniref:hypothetical protein n=1 Tax=Vibrio sp. M260112 TaxID=3020895 RepID=UPI002F412E7E
MIQLTTLLVIYFFSSLAYAGEVSIQNRHQNFLTGMIDNRIATNYDHNSLFRTIYWQRQSGTVVSEKPYYFLNSTGNDSVKFCIKENNKAAQCSRYYQSHRPNGARSIQRNSGSMTNIINNSENLQISDVFSATASFHILQGQFSFLYHQVEDQDGSVLSANFTESTTSVLNNISVPLQASSVRSCSLGGFAYGSPISISSCSDPVPVVDPNDEPFYQWSGRMYYTHMGPFDNLQQGRDACSNSTYANYNDWSLVKLDERLITKPLERVREAPFNLLYTGGHEVGVGVADDALFYWTYATNGRLIEHKFKWWSVPDFTYDTVICTRRI